MDRKISINTHIMLRITGLPSTGPDLTIYFLGKEKDEYLSNTMKDKYGLEKNTRSYDIASINDKSIGFITRVLSRKLLRKRHPTKSLQQ